MALSQTYVKRTQSTITQRVSLFVALFTLLLLAGCSSEPTSSRSLNDIPPQSLSDSLRPATMSEKWAVRGEHGLSVLEDMEFNRIFVATKDLRTTGHEGSLTIIFPRDPHDPQKTIKWLGGPVGTTALLFEAEIKPGESKEQAIQQGLLYRDPLCQLAAHNQAPWTVCDVAPYDRQPGTHKAMQSRLQPAPSYKDGPYITADQPKLAAAEQRDWYQAVPGDITLSPPKNYKSAQSIALEKGVLSVNTSGYSPATNVVGGELGANTLLIAHGYEGIEKFQRKYIYDAFCVPSATKAGPIYALADWQMFLPDQMIEHIKTSCVRD